MSHVQNVAVTASFATGIDDPFLVVHLQNSFWVLATLAQDKPVTQKLLNW
jgi:hypothetical protein